jgi:hypothetical protein
MAEAYWNQWSHAEINSLHGVELDECQDSDENDDCDEEEDECDNYSCPKCYGSGCNYCLMCCY